MHFLYSILPLAFILYVYRSYPKILGLMSSLNSYVTCVRQRNTRDTAGASSIQKEKPTPNSNSSFYALIIGIDKYLNIDPLKGAAADAKRVEGFLVNDLLVPRDQIINLRDQDASREAIIQGLHKLRDDPRIKIGDPILVYFAGHGGSRRDPRGRQEGRTNQVQVIFPQDYGLCKIGSSDPVNCIPDYTISSLLNELAASKGNNITIVFDSCHSASGSRDALESSLTLRPRHAPVLYEIPGDLDADIIKMTPGQSVSRAVDPILRTDQASHVLLAAYGQGQFTTALLTALKTCGVENLTYHNLLISLPKLANQSPECYGMNKSRTLFDSRASSLKPTYIPVTLDGNALVLAAGSASGVVSESIWEVHDSTTNDSPSFGRFIAGTPRISTTVLNPETDTARQSAKLALTRDSATQSRLYARQVGAGVGNELKVWFSAQATNSLFPGGASGHGSLPNRTYTHEVGYIQRSRESADVLVEVDNVGLARGSQGIVFSLCDPLAEENKVSRVDQRKLVHRDDVEAVLFAAAKWNWHLRRTNSQHTEEPSQSTVLIGMYKVGEKIRENYREFLPIPEPILASHNDHNHTEVVELVTRGRDLYGVNLVNKKNVALYVKMFYFDTTDFSIVHLFGHSTSNQRGDPELAASGELLIGDGGDGGSPLKFTVQAKRGVELGYLKVFWSTDPLEMDDVAQTSPFNLKSSRGIKPIQRGRAMKDWGTACLALVQRSP
ncbi:hypothetical protein B0J17DRAFT_663253 [Rhizoctonia solani]|nr:hypothetical protein B0J17DRAFT_663253 [Rhizoctonia solani]